MIAYNLFIFALGVVAAVATPLDPGSDIARGCEVKLTREQILAAEAHFNELNAQPPITARAASVSVPIVFHVIQKDNTLAGGNVPQSQIINQVAVLNNDYEQTGLTFNLANITRTVSPSWFDVNPRNSDDLVMKTALRMGGRETLNVYLVGWDSYPLFGYSNMPHEYDANPINDGVVIRFTTLPGGTSQNYNSGRTLTHETGHWVGLYHTFTEDAGGCDSDGDFVDDTPTEAIPASGCPIGRDTCPGAGVDPIHNFMDYTYDDCMTEFTPGQIQRLRAQLRIFRGFKI